MFQVRAPYVAPFLRSNAGVRVGAEASSCAGDQPAGAVTSAGSFVLVGAPVLGAVLGCALLKMPVAGAVVLAILGAAAVLNPGSGAYGMRRKVSCSNVKWEEQTA